MIRWSKKIPLCGHVADVLDLAWTRDSKYIISVGMDRRIMIWQI
jgi:WD40 repeat protein